MLSFKKGIAKALICVLIVSLVLYTLDFALYPCTFVRNDVHAITASENDLIILGSSNGKMGLNPDKILLGTGKTGQNLCVGGEYPVDAYYLAKLAIEKHKPEQIVFELDPGYFMTEKEPGNNFLLFYHEFPLSKPKVQYFADTMLDSDLRTLLFPSYEYSLGYELSHAKDTLTRKLSSDYDVRYFKTDIQEYHENGFIERYPVAEKDFPKYTPELFDEKNVIAENLVYIDKLIKLCNNNNVELTVVIMPLPDTILQQYAESHDKAWAFFDDYFADAGVRYMNFNSEYSDEFSHNIEHYVDYDGHMNGNAADEFSTLFGALMRSK